MLTKKDQIWVKNSEIDGEEGAKGVVRKVLAYTDELMTVENHFEKGAVGALHHHPHTQITYVVSGKFEFTIGEEKRIVTAGDTML
nr:cupin domain-containing protein [Lachnospiraceae bacterium]